MTVQAEYAIDRAKNRLDAIQKAEGECQTAIEEAIAKLATIVGCSSKDANRTTEAAWEAVGELTSDIRSDLERDIGRHEDAISSDEWLDMNRSRPVL